MIFLLKCLVTVFLYPQPLSLPKYVLNPKSNSASPIFPIRTHRVDPRHSHCQTQTNRIHRNGSRSHRDGLANSLYSFVLTSVSPSLQIGHTEMACQLSVFVCTHFGLTEFCKSVTPRWLVNSLLPYCFTSVLPSLCNRSHRDLDCLSHCTSVHPRCSYRSHRDS